jgi:hypothetical protein
LANKRVTSGDHKRGRGYTDDGLGDFSNNSLFYGTHRWGLGVRRFQFGKVLRFGFGFGRACRVRGRGMGLWRGFRWGRVGGGRVSGGQFGGTGTERKGVITTTYKRGRGVWGMRLRRGAGIGIGVGWGWGLKLRRGIGVGCSAKVWRW